MIDIDIRTILFYLSLGNFFILIFLIFIGVSKSRVRSNQFILAKLFQSIAWILLATREVVPGVYSFYISNFLLLVGFGAEMLSLVTYKVKWHLKAKVNYYLIIFVLFGLFAFTRILYPEYSVTIASLSTGIIFAFGGLGLITRKNHSKYSFTIGWANLVFSLILFTRMFSSFMNTYDLFSRNIIEQITFISVFLILLLNTMGYLLLLKQLDEDEILTNNEKLEKLNNEKNKFFSIIAHDLRGPIGNLSTLGEILKDQIDDLNKEEKEKLILSINNSANETYKLLTNLLEWSQAEIDGLEVRTTKINLKELVQSNILLLQEIANAKSIELTNLIADHIYVVGDANMLNTIIRNLLSNSLKFTANRGQITIDAQNLVDGFVQVSVKDTGIGMDPDSIKKLFKIDLYYSTKGTQNESGTGLGLILCQEFVKKNEGKIWVESTVNEGSTFFFTFKEA